MTNIIRTNASIRQQGQRVTSLVPLLLLSFIITGIFFAPPNLFPQSKGFKYITNYTDLEPKWRPQNWAILQDKRGCVYVGNQGVLLEFDGVSWRWIILRNRTVRSLAMDEKTGRVYVGGLNEIGFLAPGAEGNHSLQYHSLLAQIPKNKRNFQNVVRTHAASDGIYFRTALYLFRCRNNQLTTAAETDHKHRFKGSFQCNGDIFLRKDKVGLMQLVKGNLEPVPGGEIFATKSIFMMAPHGHDKLLIGTRGYGFYLFHRRTGGRRFQTRADDYLKKNKLTYGIRLKCGDYALASKMGGIVIMDAGGHVRRLYTKDTGLPENYVSYLYQDDRGNLWATLDKGVSKIEHASPFEIYHHRAGLPGMVLATVIHENQRNQRDLYAGTSRGLFYLGNNGKFQPVPAMPQKCNHLLSVNGLLIAATNTGVFLVDHRGGRRILAGRSHVLTRSNMDEKRIWAGTREGLVALYLKPRTQATVTVEHRFPNTPEPYTIAEEMDGTLWLGSLTKGATKLVFPQNGPIASAAVFSYQLPKSMEVKAMHVFYGAGSVLFGTQMGLYGFDELEKGFIPDTTLGQQFTEGSCGIFRLTEDKNKNLWFHSKNRNYEAERQNNMSYRVKDTPFLRLPPAQINVIYPDPNENAVWLGGNDGLIRYDATVKKDYRKGFQTLIRRVTVNGVIVHDGCPDNVAADTPHHEHKVTVLAAGQRHLRFRFAAPFYEGETMTRYRTFLEGYDREWSAPLRETNKDYTNLDSGAYTFRVKSINVYAVTGTEAVFRFKIPPPWHQSWWALCFYALMAILTVFLIVKWRSAKLEKEKRRLEGIVEKRTGEIRIKNQQLEHQTIRLKEQSEKLTEMDKIKTRFFANISHEFRTPLTLIMGPLEEMLDEENGNKETERKRKLGLMLRNSRRLLNLINQLLELSKIESGKMVLDCETRDFVLYVKGIAASFEPVAQQNQLQLECRCPDQPLPLVFDAAKMEDVIFNLLSNAVKFTPPGGQITVTVTRREPDGGAFPMGGIALSVRDTGPGIPREQLERIFDRFYQSEHTYEHHKKGSGIGLTIAKELAELHGGKLDVHSIEGQGTEFIIRLPHTQAPLNTKENDETPTLQHPKPAADNKIKMSAMEEAEPTANESANEHANEHNDTDETPAAKRNIILVVDDSADTRAYIRGALEPEYQVTEAKDGNEGIEKAKEIVPDLIVSDIMMPGCDGHQLCRTLKNHINTSHIPIILLTARAGEDDVLEGLETGADDYITKPFNTKILLVRIKNLIDLRGNLQQALDRHMVHRPVKVPVSNIDKDFITKLNGVIRANISDPDFNIEQLCEKMEMSQSTLYRKIHALSGESPTEFIRSYRLKRAARLLEENFGTVLETALEVGFSSAAYFTKCFKKKFNRLPSQIHENNGATKF